MTTDETCWNEDWPLWGCASRIEECWQYTEVRELGTIRVILPDYLTAQDGSAGEKLVT